MEYKNIEFESKDGVGTVWLNRPKVHNALNAEMISEISDCYISVDNMEDVRVAVIRGRGKSFCAGADLKYMKDTANDASNAVYHDSLKLAKCFDAIYSCQKPTIAVVHGAAVGGGNGLFSACDFAYCDDDSKFRFSEVKLGLVPAVISPYVIRRIGQFPAKDLMLTGRMIRGKEAEAFGLVNKSLAGEDVDEQVNTTINELMTSGPNAVTKCKELIHEVSNFLVDDALDYTASVIAEMRESEEGQEGMNSFLEKRKPNWVKK